MNHYFYVENGKQFGPFTVEELKEKRLKKTVLVWTDGMNEWRTADTVDELKDIVISIPPPLIIDPPKNSPVINSKYDLNYEKDTEATVIGCIFMICTIAANFGINASRDEGVILGFAIVSLFFRLLFTYWVVDIATRQNRDTMSWGFFAFFFPSLAMIIIGQLKKLRVKKY